jgi:hypothetical protein
LQVFELVLPAFQLLQVFELVLLLLGFRHSAFEERPGGVKASYQHNHGGYGVGYSERKSNSKPLPPFES